MRYLKLFEDILVRVLIGMMILVVMLSVVDLGRILISAVISPPRLLVEVDELLNIIGTFLVVLIGVELLEALQVYLKQKKLSAEVILLVAIIALSKRIITLDLAAVPGATLLGIAALTAAVSWAYYSIRKIHAEKGRVGPEGVDPDKES